MTASAAKSRLTHYVATTEKMSYRDAENVIRSMTPSERVSLSVKAKKWRDKQAKAKADRKS